MAALKGDEMLQVDEFKSGMRRLASGVSLITTIADGKRHGLVATADDDFGRATPDIDDQSFFG